MRRLAVLALAAAAALPAGAHATPPTVAGTSCGLVAFNDATGAVLIHDPDVYLVVAGAAVAAVDTAHVDGNPAAVHVRCRILRNGAFFADSTSTEAPVPADPVYRLDDFARVPGDILQVCTTVTATDAFGATRTWYYDASLQRLVINPGAECPTASFTEVVPRPVCDLLPCPLYEGAYVVVPQPVVA